MYGWIDLERVGGREGGSDFIYVSIFTCSQLFMYIYVCMEIYMYSRPAKS